MLVKFISSLSQAQYDALATKDENAIYFIANTGRIYKGSTLYAGSGVKNVVVNAVTGVMTVSYTDGSADQTFSLADIFILKSEKGQPNGVATLGATGLIPASQLPSFVDDIIEAYVRDAGTSLAADYLSEESVTGAALTPESGKIYVVVGATDASLINNTYRWSGSAYINMKLDINVVTVISDVPDDNSVPTAGAVTRALSWG